MTWHTYTRSTRGRNQKRRREFLSKAGFHLYSQRFYKKKWFRMTLAICGLIGVVMCIGLFLYLKPFRDEVNELNLADIDKVQERSMILDRHGKEVGKVFEKNRTQVSIEQVPYHMVQALTAIEDSRFFEHHGIDYMGIARAAWRNLWSDSGYSQGASTITQQLARGAFSMKEKTLERKIREAFLAKRIEEHYSKPQILEKYLNRIYFGNGCYGIATAAEGYFSKPIEDLTLLECATLAGLIKNPYYLSPLKYPDKSKKARDYVLTRMAAEKMISPSEAKRLQIEPLVTNPSSQHNEYSYINDLIFSQFSDLVHNAGYENAMQGGFTITTTIDMAVQRQIRDAMRKRLDEVEKSPDYEGQSYAAFRKTRHDAGAKAVKPDYLQGSVVVMENKTGSVIALVGGRDYTDMKYNFATQANRSAGSAFKPFAYAAAFQAGKFPGSLVDDGPMKIDHKTAFVGATSGILGEWATESDRDFYARGDITLREALYRSKNNSAVRMASDIGLEPIIDVARKAGLTGLPEENHIVLGKEVSVSLIDLCTAYTTFPNGGLKHTEPHLISRITDINGKIVYDSKLDVEKGKIVKVVDPIPAYQVHSCLKDVLQKGTGAGAADKLKKGGEHTGGKTGTAYNFTDNWFVGYNSEITCGVWVGFEHPKSIYRRAFSNETAMPIWIDAMNVANEHYEPKPISPPEGTEFIEICKRSGKRALDNCHELVQEGNQMITVRTTYLELVAKNFKTDGRTCDVHTDPDGSPGGVSISLTNPSLDNSDETYAVPVQIRGPVVVGKDPYNSITVNMTNFPSAKNSASADILRPARPLRSSLGDDAYRIPIPPPPPIVFE